MRYVIHKYCLENEMLGHSCHTEPHALVLVFIQLIIKCETIAKYSLPTPNSTLLKPLYLLYTTTLSEPWVNSKSLVCVFLIFLPPLTLLTIPFFYIDSNLGLVSLTLSYPGFSLTFHLVPLLLISMASYFLPLNFSTVFLKVLFLLLYSSYSIQLHSVQ